MLIILVGFALRLYHIGTVPYRGDEAFTVLNWMMRPLSESLTTVITSDPQPPLAYASFRLWALIFGTHETTTRLLPALINLLGIPTLYLLGRRIGGAWAGVLAALLWAMHPYHIWHSQDARNYAIWGALSVLSLLLGLRAIERRRLSDWALYILSAAITAYFYYLELFTLVVLNLYVLLTHWREIPRWRQFPPLLQWIATQAVIAATLAVWFLQPRLLSGGGYGGTTGGFDAAQLLTRFIPALNFGETLPPEVATSIWPILIIIVLVGGLLFWRRNPKFALLLVMLGSVPLVLLALVSLRLNVFTPRYVLAASPAYLLLFVALIVELKQRLNAPTLRRAAVIMLIGGWLLLDAYSLHAYRTGAPKSPDWPSLVHYLDAQIAPDDVVILTSSDISFTYYYPHPFEYLPANQHQTPTEIETRLQELSETRSSLWIIGHTHPDWRGAGVIETWTAANMQRTNEASFSGASVVQFMPWTVSEAELKGDVLAAFSEVVELVGARVLHQGDTLRVWLYWRPLNTSEQPLKVFVHLLGAPNPATGTPLWAQDDHFPQNARIETTTWAVGTVYRDIYTISLAGVSTGEYQLSIGFYDPETGQRLTVEGLTVEAADSYTLETTVTVP